MNARPITRPLRSRYQPASKKTKAAILDEFCSVCGHPRMQTEARHLTYRVAKVIFWITGRQRLKGKHFAPCLRPHRDAVGDRVTEQLCHWSVVN